MPQAYANTVSASDALKKMNEIIAFRLAVHELIPADLYHLDTRKPGHVNSARDDLTDCDMSQAMERRTSSTSTCSNVPSLSVPLIRSGSGVSPMSGSCIWPNRV